MAYTCLQIAQDDEAGFEIASFRGSLDELEDSGTPSHGENSPNPLAPNSASAQGKSLPEQTTRHSLDGETIFAVGEDGDKWSDDDEDQDASGKRA